MHSQLLVLLLLLGKCKVAGSIPVRDTIPLWVTSEGHLPARRSFFIGSSVTFQVILHKDSMWKYKVHFRCSSHIWAAFCCGSHLYKTFAVFDLFKSPQTSAAASGHYFDVNDAYSDRIK